MRTEPVRAAILGLVTAALGLLIAFGVDLTPERVAAIVGFTAAAITVGEIVRARVTPTK